MTAEPIISVSGLRGIIGESLDPIGAIRYAAAYATGLGSGPIVVTRDGRATGKMLADAVRSSLTAMGFDVIDAQVAATPTTGVLVRHLQAVAGIQISASHNPKPYNGMKLFGAHGRVISADQGGAVIQRYHHHLPKWVSHDRVGQVHHCTDTVEPHLQRVLATVDVDKIRACQFHVLLDSNHGAGSALGLRLLQSLGCQVTALGEVADGQFEHPPEPTAENLQEVTREVTRVSAVVGFCQDPDADRLAIIDEQGSYIGEEYTLAITLDHALSQNPGLVVTNCATSRMSEDLAAKYGASLIRSAVGEANVTDQMIAHQAVYGGEGNGGPIDPRVGYVRDSFVAMAQVLDAMAHRQASISELVAQIPRYEICKTKVSIGGLQVDRLLDQVERQFPDAQASRLDGLRLDWDDRWVLIRASNTEPIVRVIAEAVGLQEAQDMCDQVQSIIG